MSQDKILSVIQKADSFFYTEHAKNELSLNVRDIHRLDLTKDKSKDRFGSQRYSRINLGVSTEQFTLLPSGMDFSTLSGDALAPLIQLNDTTSIRTDNVYSYGLRIVYAFPRQSYGFSWLDELADRTDDLRVSHYFSPILLNLSYRIKQDGVFVFIEKHEIGVVVIMDQQPILVNTYKINEVEEYLYFILLAFDQTGMSIKDETLFLSGQINKDTKLFEYLFKYVRNISFMDHKMDATKGGYRYFDLHSLMLYG